MDDQDIFLLIKYLNNECNQHELIKVAELLTNPSNQERIPELLEEASKKFHGDFETSPQHQKKSWSRIHTELSDRRYATDKSPRPNRNWLKIAASIIILLGAGLLIRLYIDGIQHPYGIDKATAQIKTVANERGEKSKLTLPDGTIVIMNSGTTITYPEKFNDDVRSVSLKGEAYFDVTENSRQPFVVEVKGVITTVLGTTFNIRAYDYHDQVKVSLTSGKIDIQLPGNANELILDPGQELIYDMKASDYMVDEFDSDEVLDWQKGILRFDGGSEQQAINMMEHWYDVNIDVVNSTSNKWENLSAKYDNEPLENVLLSLSYTLDFNYEINGKDIKIIYN